MGDIIELIVECALGDEKEELIKKYATIKYSLPLIDSYVIEIDKNNLSKLEGIEGITNLQQTAKIAAQMNNARKAVGADKVQRDGYLGEGITLAVLDTGISPIDDFSKPLNRILCFKDFVYGKIEAYDDNGHGTHVAGIAAGSGINSFGEYRGIAPCVNIVGLKVLDKEGAGSTSDVLAGIQWMVDNKEKYNIRVANLSVGTEDILTKDPLVKAVEAAWDKGITVVVAAGNNGPAVGTVTSPGVSRKVITVGASDDSKTVEIWGDVLENYSGRGPTKECIMKPDVLAPGADIISCLTSTPFINNKQYELGKTFLSKDYLQMSGTSMSTPIVSGAVVLLLQKNPNLKPNDIKYLLKKTSENLNYPQNQQGWGLINIEKLLKEEI